MTRPTLTDAEKRLDRIIRELSRASKPTLSVVERALGITTGPESPDAGRPFEKEARE